VCRYTTLWNISHLLNRSGLVSVAQVLLRHSVRRDNGEVGGCIELIRLAGHWSLAILMPFVCRKHRRRPTVSCLGRLRSSVDVCQSLSLCRSFFLLSSPDLISPSLLTHQKTQYPSAQVDVTVYAQMATPNARTSKSPEASRGLAASHSWPVSSSSTQTMYATNWPQHASQFVGHAHKHKQRSIYRLHITWQTH